MQAVLGLESIAVPRCKTGSVIMLPSSSNSSYIEHHWLQDLGSFLSPSKEGERQIREQGPCIEDVWLLARAGAVLGNQRNNKAKHHSCCDRFNGKSDVWKIEVLCMQYKFKRVTGASNNSQQNADSYESTVHACVYPTAGHARYAFCLLEISQYVSKIAPRKAFLSSQDEKLKMQRTAQSPVEVKI